MEFYINETIAVPFSAYYYGYVADLGANPAIFINVFSVAENKLIDVPSFLDIKSIDQVGNDTLILGIAYINKVHNTLAAGEYRLKIGLKKGGSIIDLLYVPITLVAHKTPYFVSNSATQSYLAGIVSPGVKNGFNITASAESYAYNVGVGTLFTDDGIKIALQAPIEKAFRLDPAGANGRTDTICIVYDSSSVDEQGSAVPPKISVVKGLEDSFNTLGSTPPGYYKIAYAHIPFGSPSKIFFSMCRAPSRVRPAYSVPAVEQGNGIKAIFEFPIEIVDDTDVVEVDGLPQRRLIDYKVQSSVLNRTLIKFVGEVPQTTQRVTISGSTPIGDFYPVPGIDSQVVPDIALPSPTYSRSGLVAEFSMSTFEFGKWADSTNNTSGFTQSSFPETPLRGWDGTTGEYVFLDGYRWMEAPSILVSNEWTVVLVGNFRDIPKNDYWKRLLTKADGASTQFSLMMKCHDTTPLIRAQFGSSSAYAEMTIENAFGSMGIVRPWDVDRAVIAISKSAENNLILRYGGLAVSAAIPQIGWGTGNWVLGKDLTIGTTSAAYGKVTGLLFYDHVITNTELSEI